MAAGEIFPPRPSILAFGVGRAELGREDNDMEEGRNEPAPPPAPAPGAGVVLGDREGMLGMGEPADGELEGFRAGLEDLRRGWGIVDLGV
jgi:hypothetical protein